jgi:hypothetical protein
MAAKNFGRVNVSITASTGGLTAGLSRAGKQMQSFAGTVSSTLNPLRMLSSVAQSTFGQLALFSMARGAVNTLTGMASAASENIDVQSKLSRRLGMTYGELAGLKLAGDLAGVGIESIAAAMTKSDVAMQKAAGGSKAANAAFATLGLSVDKLQGMSAADRFSAIAESISALPTSAERAAAAVALFGRSGAQLLPLFEQGAGGIARAREEAEKFGLALTNAQGQNVEEMNDSFTRVYSAIQGIVQQVVAHLAPAITAIAKQFTDFVGSVGGANIGQAIGEALLQGARFLAQIGDYLIQNFGGVFAYLTQIGAQWGEVFDLGNRVASFFGAVGDTLQAVFGVIILGITGPVESLIGAAKTIGDALYLDTSSLDSALAGMEAFNNKITEDISANGKSAYKGFRDALSADAAPVGEAIAGPLTATLDSAIAHARAAAATVDEKTQGSVRKVLDTEVKATVNTDALKAIVVGTSEGEAFRNSLLRGADPRNAGAEEEKRTADATEETAAGVDELVSIMRDQFAIAEITV